MVDDPRYEMHTHTYTGKRERGRGRRDGKTDCVPLKSIRFLTSARAISARVSAPACARYDDDDDVLARRLPGDDEDDGGGYIHIERGETSTTRRTRSS